MTTPRAGRRRHGFDEFFEAHYDEVVRALTLATGDRDRAEDAAQEAFAKAYRKWQDVVCMERPVGWVLIVAVNQMRRWFGRANRRVPPAAPLVAGGSSPQGEIDGIAEHAPLHEALDRLAPRQRATVVLRYLCDLSTQEVADALRCSTGTVKSSLHSALANLRIDLEAADTTEQIALQRPLGESSALAVSLTPLDDESGEPHASR